MKLKIVCDCDNVLLDFSKGFAKWNNSKFEDIHTDECPETYDFGFGESDSALDTLWERIKLFWKTPNMAKLEPMEPGIVENFKKLCSDYSVSVISAVDKSVKDSRLENLEEFGVKDDNLLLDVNKIDKIINEIRPNVCIEDSPENIIKLCNAGITVFYPRYVKYTKNINEDIAIPYDNWENLLYLLGILQDMVEHSTK